MELNYSKLPEKVIKVFTDQVKTEYNNASFYKAAQYYCKHRDLDNFAKWFCKQSDEEKTHARIFGDFLLSKNIKLDMPSTDTVKSDFKNLKDLLIQSLNGEKNTTDKITLLTNVCLSEKCFQGFNVGLRMLDVQIEEEKEFIDLLERVKILEDNDDYEFILDNNLGDEE